MRTRVSDESAVRAVLSAINRAWRSGQPQSMAEHLDPEMTMVLLGFNGVVSGRSAFLAGFDEFCKNARVLEYLESDELIQVIGDCAFDSYRFDVLYERARYRERSRGRDLWVFKRAGDRWIAVWRTMFDLEEYRVTEM
jgi:uncharacterized protein (TIGR02246 family)